MSQEAQPCEMLLREASIGDISILAVHHRKMFEEIWEKKGEHLETERASEIERAYAEKLAAEMINGN